MNASMAVQDQAGSMVIPHHARGARLARQRLALRLREVLPPAMLTDAVAVVGELLGNAVRHADPLPGGVIRLAWRVGPGRSDAAADGIAAKDVFVELRVTDGGSARAVGPRVVGPDSVDGRGLAIVAALARRWGVDRVSDGQSVWAELGSPIS